MHYEIYGQGQSIYFIHGHGLSLVSMVETYEKIFSDLSNYQRIYIDLPGMGQSVADYQLDSSHAIAKALVELIKSLTPDDQIILFGHSYGGYLSLAINYLMPERIKKIFLTCPPVKAIKEERKLAEHKNVCFSEFEIDPKYAKAYYNMSVVISPETLRRYQRISLPGIEVFDSDYDKFLQREDQRYLKLPFEAEMYAMDPQLCLILGRNDQIVGFKDQIKAFIDKDNASIYLIENAGHNIMIDQLDFVRDSAKAFLTDQIDDEGTNP
ncbi:alpha/beta fold hydrolase [Ignavigranum ruoffiae]|uniref:Pimeloyl-ACP methyl ester carboxylesterase n=1 Tax=Ignavigranum ruoffiae TaxID=89093 RepID=A0A1H9CMC2_9LACT|nr:alpha/beta hydrolase [Ignavigranum ruoffiae]UPQ86639.1 alpha/beta hydrolase [Ignavigranum ruoffiae]SEQ02314.1 Pimeloyl-ACP methyl ester carboxylesterase [Ignavigranum ruoffiae]